MPQANEQNIVGLFLVAHPVLQRFGEHFVLLRHGLLSVLQHQLFEALREKLTALRATKLVGVAIAEQVELIARL